MHSAWSAPMDFAFLSAGADYPAKFFESAKK